MEMKHVLERTITLLIFLAIVPFLFSGCGISLAKEEGSSKAVFYVR
jgi:hypothetical protein